MNKIYIFLEYKGKIIAKFTFLKALENEKESGVSISLQTHKNSFNSGKPVILTLFTKLTRGPPGLARRKYKIRANRYTKLALLFDSFLIN